MADERILAAVRDIWTTEEVATNRAIILNAIFGRLENVTVIIGKASDGDSATGQVVVNSADYLGMLDVLNARTLEIEAAADGVTAELQQTGHVNFGNRYGSY